MKLLLHYLKFDFRRWRFPVLLLWGLVALHSVLFIAAEMTESQDWSYRQEDRLLNTIPPSLANWTLVWASLLVVLIGVADSRVRGTTWLLTRAGNRRIWLAARLGFVLLAVVLPLALGYAVMPLAARFDGLTVLHAFWLALRTAAVLAVALWLWARAWPHVPAMVLGFGVSCSVGLLLDFAGLHIPEQWRMLPPHFLVLIICLTLPALVCLRAAGKEGRRAAVYGWLAGLLLPVLLLASAGVSCGLRKVFPGPLEFALFQFGAERETLTAQGELSLHVPLRSDLPFVDLGNPATVQNPAVAMATIFAASWQQADSPAGEWSHWQDASGGISRNRGVLLLDSFRCDTRDLRGTVRLNFRVRVLVTLTQSQTLPKTPADGFHHTGHGWLFDSGPQPESGDFFFLHRVRLAPGMSLEQVTALLADKPAFFGSSYTGYRDRWYHRLPGFDFSERRWDLSRVAPNPEERLALSRAPLTLVVTEREYSLREWRINGLTVKLGKGNEVPPVKKEPAPTKDRPVSPEPFDHYISTVVWPPAVKMPAPGLDSSLHEVAFYFHWLKGLEFSEDTTAAAPLVAKWWRESLQAAAIEPLGEKCALLRAIAEGLPEEHRGDLFDLLPRAPWLMAAVEQRGWQEAAKPAVLKLMLNTPRMPEGWMAVCRSYRDPAFNEWMIHGFRLDVPTILYWESMPGLKSLLPEKLGGYVHRSLSTEEREAMLTSGDSRYLEGLLASLKKDWGQKWAAIYLHKSVLDENGQPPPPTGLEEDVQQQRYSQKPVSPEFLKWFDGVSVNDFVFDRTRRLFVRKPSTSKAP